MDTESDFDPCARYTAIHLMECCLFMILTMMNRIKISDNGMKKLNHVNVME